MKTRGLLLRNALLLVAAIVLLNLVGQRFKFRADLTGDKRYTLSAATLKMLKELPEPVTVTAFFTEKMPPELALLRQDFKDLLVEYAARSNGNVVFEFIDPNSADSLEQRAQQSGIKPLLAQTREKDKAENLQVYMGAVVRLGERKSVIPVVDQGNSLEWTLSSAIKEVSISQKPTIGVMQGQHEPSTSALGQLISSLSVMYTVQPTMVWDTVPINDNWSALLMIDPQDTLSPLMLQRLQEYMNRGHGVVFAYSAIASDLNTSPMATVRHIGLDTWLAHHGVQVLPRIVVDAECTQVQVMQQMGNFSLPVPLAFPWFPKITHFSTHPIASGLDLAIMQFAAPLSFTGDSSYTYSPLVMTSDKSGVIDAPVTIDIHKQWTDGDFTQGPQTLAVAMERKLGGASRSRFVVFSNGGFCTSGQGQQQQQLPKGNIDLMVNAVDWVTNSNGLLELRGKEVNYRPIDDISEAKRSSLKWMNLLLPVLMAFGYGLARWQWRRKQRVLRMAPDHVR